MARGIVGREGTALSRQLEPVQGSSLIKAKNINRRTDNSTTSSVLRLPNYFALLAKCKEGRGGWSGWKTVADGLVWVGWFGWCCKPAKV